MDKARIATPRWYWCMQVLLLCLAMACAKTPNSSARLSESRLPYPEIKDDIMIVRQLNGIIGCCGPNERSAATRFFTNVDLTGLTRLRVLKLLGLPNNLSYRVEPGLVDWRYSFDSGLGGVGYEVKFRDNKVYEVTEFFLE